MEQLLRLLQKAGSVRGMKILFVIEDGDLWRLQAIEKKIGSLGGGLVTRIGPSPPRH